MGHQGRGQVFQVVVVPSASDILFQIAGGQFGCVVLFELVSSMSPVVPKGLGSWRRA